jgi:hypothetical protein
MACRRAGIALVLVVACAGDRARVPPAARAVTTLYVAPRGDDRAVGTPDAPFATIAHARDVARAAHVKEIVVRGGTYFLDEPLALGAGDSGLTIRSNEHAVISGGVRIGGFTQTEVNGHRAWTTIVRGPPFRELFVNGERRPRTRLPRSGYFHPTELPDVRPDASFGKDSNWLEGEGRFRFAPGDLKAWTNLGDVEVIALHFWVESRMPIASVDEKERLVTFVRPSVFRLTEGFAAAPLARYYVENVFEALGAPGEWYLDRKMGVLTYLPRANEEIASTEVIAPRLEQLVRIEGAEDVHLRGLELRDAEPRDVPPSGQAAVNVPGAIWMKNTKDSALEDLVIAQVGGYGVELAGGCERDRIVRCDIGDLGAGGIKIGEEKVGGAETGHDEVTDCHVHDGGLVYRSAVGIWIGQSDGNVIAHNHVHDFDYTGISVGWTWGYKPSGAHDNVIEKNHIHDIGRGVLSDMGGVYTLGPSPGTVIRGNVIHDITDFAYGGWGIYFDEGTTGVVAEKNVVYRTRSSGFFQNYGEKNAVVNDVFALSGEGGLMRGKEEGSITFERNIVWVREGELFAWNWKSGDFRLDRNVYWNAAGKPITFAGNSLAAWQERGLDVHSIVANPLFVDPDHGDFGLREGSPATSVGFEPIDVRDVGPRR